MKVLIIQLARFGDNFQTWPVVKSFKRNNPGVELHYLCRETFRSSVSSLDEIDQLLTFDSAKHVHHVLDDSDKNLFISIDKDLDKLKSNEYDQVINLTFSPLSSYITSYLEKDVTKVLGFTRHEDGYLNIPDDASALIFGQLGLNKYNRIHLTRLFSAVVGVDLLEEDWVVSDSLLAKGAIRFPDLPDNYLALHIGGSNGNKLLSAHQWRGIVAKLSDSMPEMKFILLGSKSEMAVAEEVKGQSDCIISLVGKTDIEDLFYIINRSEILIAPDSALIHMSSLLNKKCINLSFASVNFWETGPLATDSYVLWTKQPNQLNIDETSTAILDILKNQKLKINYAKVKENSSLEAYELHGYESRDFEWDLIKAIYLGHEFPILDDLSVYNAFKQFAELADMAIRDLEMVRSGQFQNMNLEIIANVERLVGTLEKLVPEVRPIIWWFNTEKARIGPWADQEVFDRNCDIYNQLRSLLSIYVGSSYIHNQLVDQK